MGDLFFNESLRKTFEKTAEHLARRPVVLRFNRPPNARAIAECYKTITGVHIDIDPSLSIAEACEVALHEIAHARLHNDLMPTLKPSETRGGKAQKTNVKSFEDQAKTTAAQWWEWARKHTPVNWRMNDEQRAIAYMTALLFYKG